MQCDADISGSLRVLGDGQRGNAVFFVRGDNTIFATWLNLETDSIRFEGSESTCLEAYELWSPPQIRIHLGEAKVGWGGVFISRYPWSTLRATLTAPYRATAGGP
jgi:hypothetical protein